MDETHVDQTHGYRERLWPGPAVWLVMLGGAAALALAYGRALGATVGWLVFALVVVLGAVMIHVMTAVVEVRSDGLVADRAMLPWTAAGEVLALERDGMRSATGPDGDHTAYLVLRPGVGPGGVVVEVTDPEDPHRTWLIASRHPEAMARAIRAARERLRA